MKLLIISRCVSRLHTKSCCVSLSISVSCLYTYLYWYRCQLSLLVTCYSLAIHTISNCTFIVKKKLCMYL